MYDVRWAESALNSLAEVWNRAPDRNAVTSAILRIDRSLAVSPENQGESRDEGRRILLEPPLGVIFRVHIESQTVIILEVWSFNRPPGGLSPGGQTPAA
jgi:hypothetical protein